MSDNKDGQTNEVCLDEKKVTRRLGLIRVSFSLIEEMLKGHSCKEHYESDCPKDLKIVGIAQPFPPSEYHNTAYLYCESESFEPVSSTETIPDIRITFKDRRVHGEKG